MKMQDLLKKSPEDLLKQLAEARGSARDLRFRISGKEVKNHQQLRFIRKDIARILTALRQKEKTA